MHNYSKRKHREQMTTGEVIAIKSEVKNIRPILKLIPHAEERMEQKGVTGEDIKRVLDNPKVVEIHNCAKNDIRVLLRRDFERFACSIVVSLTTKEIITTYKNRKEYCHKAIESGLYQWKVNVEQVLGGR